MRVWRFWRDFANTVPTLCMCVCVNTHTHTHTHIHTNSNTHECKHTIHRSTSRVLFHSGWTHATLVRWLASSTFCLTSRHNIPFRERRRSICFVAAQVWPNQWYTMTIYVCVYVCVYICVYICICIYMWIHAYIYTYHRYNNNVSSVQIFERITKYLYIRIYVHIIM